MALNKNLDFKKIKSKFQKEQASYKPDRFLDLGTEFTEATGIPGPALGHINMFLGHSDTGKTTALIKSAIDAQNKGILPVFIITEQKWDFGHAKIMGMDVESTTNENGDIVHDGFFFFENSFDYIEQITDYINHLLDEQEKGKLPYDLLFLWDSVGSVPCKMTFEGKGGKMHNASTLADKIGMGINQRIGSSRRATSNYTNTLIIVNQPWVEPADNPYAQPTIKAKGGEAIYLNSTLVFLFGNQKKAGTSNISITQGGRKLKIMARTKVSIKKNHVNGLGYEDGKILVSGHGFHDGRTPKDEKASIEQYKKNHAEYIAERLGVSISDVILSNVEDYEYENAGD
jgi:hypothetical protein